MELWVGQGSFDTNMVKYMHLRRLRFVLGAVGLLVFTGFGLAADIPRKILHGHVPPAVSKLASFGALPVTNRLSLAIGLPLRDPAGLASFLNQVYDPASTNYHRYLTPAQFTDRFGPTEADYAAVRQFAETNGLQVTATHGNRLLLDVSGSVGDIQRAFHLNLLQYHHPTEARDFFAPDVEPSMDASLPELGAPGTGLWQRMGSKMMIDATIPPPCDAEARAAFERIRPVNPQLRLEDFAAADSLDLVRSLPARFFGSQLLKR